MYRSVYSNSKALVTGGLGFIGSNLARRLVHLGANVTIVDSLVPEYGGNLINVKGFESRLRINVSDVRDEYSLKYLLRDQDFLFNLAGQTSHMDSMTDPFTDLEINCRAQLSILEACRKYNSGIKVVFASTRQIYGRPDYLPVDEQHILRPVDVNGVNKMAGEAFHILYNNVHGIRSCALRLTNTIGPGMRIKDSRQTFLGIWVRLLLEGKPFEIWGGEQLRDFTFVDDAVEAFLLAGANNASNGKAFNLGGLEQVSLKQLGESLVAINGGGEFLVKEYPAERKGIDIGDYYCDWTSIEKAIGWRPTTTIHDSLRKTVEYYREHLHDYV